MNTKLLVSSWAVGLIIFVVDIIAFLGTELFDYLLILAIIVSLVPLGISGYLSFTRSRKISQEFPILLRDIAEEEAGGMSLISAIRAASKNDYGYLNKELQVINNQLAMGLTLTESLERFSKRIGDPSIARIIRIISQSNESGGDISEIFGTVSDTATEIESLHKIRTNRMQVYVSSNYIVYGIFLLVIILLRKILVPQLSSNVLVQTDPLPDQIYLHVALIQGIFTGVVTGKLADGSYRAGVKHSIFLVILATLLFLFLQ